MKALRRQLMAAIAMVLVAAIALGSSTYAWFAANTEVTATHMSVKAVAESGIEIKEHSKDAAVEANWGSTDAAAVTTTMNLYPISTYDSSTWVHATAEKASGSTAAAGGYAVPTLSNGDTSKSAAGYGTATPQIASQKYDDDGKQYYRIDQFDIRTVKGTTAAQKVGVKEVEISTAADKVNKALRVLVVGDDGKVLYNAGAGDASRVVCATVNATGNPETKATVTYKANDEKSDLIVECPAGTAGAAGTLKTVTVYVYYEGEESQHYSNNFEATIANLDVTVHFASDDTLSAGTAITAEAATAGEQAGTDPLNP